MDDQMKKLNTQEEKRQKRRQEAILKRIGQKILEIARLIREY